MCRIEADHLHNIPTLLHEENEHRHEYYIREERGLYLQRLRGRGAVEYLEQVAIWYSEPWRVLASAAGVRLPGWDQEAEPSMHLTGGACRLLRIRKRAQVEGRYAQIDNWGAKRRSSHPAYSR